MTASIIPAEPPWTICRRFLTSDTSPGEVTLDVGCGTGDLMVELTHLGAKTQGIEINPALIESCQTRGLSVQAGSAEHIPFDTETFDRVVCSVVVPYTEEQQAVTEWARVLKPGGRVYATYHGIGYGMHYSLTGPGLRRRIYGMRMLVNTIYYQLTGRMLPGFWGDTICQTMHRLQAYYKQLGLVLEKESIAATFLGYPRFICHQLVKPLP